MLKNVKLLFLTLLLLNIISCKSQLFIDDGNGHKLYKDNTGNFVKNEWVEIKEKKYYFDLDGYLVTNEWVQNEYYVNENGEMLRDSWCEYKDGKKYYLGSDGKYLRNTKVIQSADKVIYFDDSGVAYETKGYWKKINAKDVYGDMTGEKIIVSLPFEGRFSNSVATNEFCKLIVRVSNKDEGVYKIQNIGYIDMALFEYERGYQVKGTREYYVSLKDEEGNVYTFDGQMDRYSNELFLSMGYDTRYPDDVMFNYLMSGKSFKLYIDEIEKYGVPATYLFKVEGDNFRFAYNDE